MKPRIVELPEFHVLGVTGLIPHGTTSGFADVWNKFGPLMGGIANRVGTESMSLTKAGKDGIQYTACVKVASPATAPDGMVAQTIPKRSYAVFTHTGHIAGIAQTWGSIMSEWFPASGFTHLPDAPDFEIYDERWNAQTMEGPVDIYLPIEAKKAAAKPKKKPAKAKPKKSTHKPIKKATKKTAKKPARKAKKKK